MPSDIEIRNIALSRVAHTQPIVSFTEKSKAAELCSVFYATLRELVLADFPWPFAESIVTLADIGSPAPGWAYRYRYLHARSGELMVLNSAHPSKETITGSGR